MAKKDHSAAPIAASAAAAAATTSAAPVAAAGNNHVSNNSNNHNSGAAEVNAAHEHLSATANDYFTQGSVVKCVLFTNSVVEGEVMAFDPATRMIAIKGPATNKRLSHNNVSIVNLNMVSDVVVVSECKETKPADPPTLNLTRLNSRAVTNIERKKRNAKACKAGISPYGQKLFQVISKTLDEIDWNGENICVMNKVTISPPYRPENVKGVSDKAVNHVKKIVEKHMEDQRRLSEEASSAADASSSSSSTPTPVSPPASSSLAPATAAATASGATSLSSSSSSSASSSASGTPTVSAAVTPTSTSNTSAPSPVNNGPPSRRPVEGGGGRGGGGGKQQKNSPSSRGGGANATPKPMYFMQ